MAEELTKVLTVSQIAKSKGIEQSTFLVQNISQSAQTILDAAFLAIAGTKLDALKPMLPDYIGAHINVAGLLKTVNVEDFGVPIEATLTADYEFILDSIKAGLGGHVGGLYAGLYENLVGSTALLQSYTGLLHRITIEPYISRYFNNMIRPNIPDIDSALFMHHLGALSLESRNAYINQAGWEDTFIGAIEKTFIRQPPIDMLLDFRRRGYITNDTLITLLKWFRLDSNAAENVAKMAIQYPEPYRLAEMHSKGILDTTDYINLAGNFGLTGGHALAWSEAQRKYPDFATAIALLRRGDITNENFLFWMIRNQFEPSEADVMLNLKEAIPPIQDLIRFAVREAYGSHTYDEQYAAMVTNAKRMGLTDEAAGWYWWAHWDRIPLTLMYQNYYRGNWDSSKLRRMLALVDIHPDDREDIINVAYAPPSIRELGYGFDVGAYSVEDVVKFRRWGGLSPSDAEVSGQAMVLYRTEAEREAVRRANMNLYKLDKISREEFEAAIRAITPNEAAIQLWLERGDLERQIALKPSMDTEGRIVSSSEAITAFKLKLRDENWLRESLKALDWTDERVNVAVERAKLEIKTKEEEEKEVKYRKLTIAQLANMYKLNLITKEQMVVEVVLIGYTSDDAELLVEVYTRPEVKAGPIKNYTISDAARLYHYQLFDEEDIYNNYLLDGYSEDQSAMLTLMTRLNLEYPILVKLYERGEINAEQFSKALQVLGMDEYDAINLTKRMQYEYQVSRLATEKELTKAEILKGAKNNVLTVNQASNLLQDIGYDQSEAYYLLAINKVVEAGDPEGYWDMRRVTENYKKARGELYIDIPDELIMLEKQQKQYKTQLNEANKHPEKEQEISDLTQKLGGIESAMKQIITSRKLS